MNKRITDATWIEFGKELVDIKNDFRDKFYHLQRKYLKTKTLKYFNIICIDKFFIKIQDKLDVLICSYYDENIHIINGIPITSVFYNYLSNTNNLENVKTFQQLLTNYNL